MAVVGMVGLYSTRARSQATAPKEPVTVGFIYVGPRADYGYNYAADQGRLALEQQLPWVKTLQAENIPENAEVERVMEQMIRQGATVLFPTSYGYLDFALRLARRYPKVTFLHQGGLRTDTNVGTYFGTIWQTVYIVGTVAGQMTRSGKLGFVAAHPIPQVLLNINAFHLGARSVNPKVETHVIFTGGWYNPAKETEAANSLIDLGVDVTMQHQDSPIAVVQTAERRGVFGAGYHADLSKFAPRGWLTGAVWKWGELYVSMVQAIAAGTWKSSMWRGGLKEGVVDLAPFGSVVPPDVQQKALALKQQLIADTLDPFAGPIKDQAGSVRIAAGQRPDVRTLETTDWLAEGVVGKIPK